MSVIERLMQSAKNNHGRTLQPDEVGEIVEALAALQYYATEWEIKNEALTRVAAIALQRLGGGMILTPDEYDAAVSRGVELTWDDDEEGGTIYAKAYQVDVPQVRPEDDTAERQIDGDMAPVPSDWGTQLELALEEDDKG